MLSQFLLVKNSRLACLGSLLQILKTKIQVLAGIHSYREFLEKNLLPRSFRLLKEFISWRL